MHVFKTRNRDGYLYGFAQSPGPARTETWYYLTRTNPVGSKPAQIIDQSVSNTS